MRKKSIPVILIDNREQLPYLFTDYNIPIVYTTLATGDYSVAIQKGDELIRYDHLIDIERKSLDNYVNDISNAENRERFERSVQRGSKLQFYAVYIEGTEFEVLSHHYEGQVNPTSVLHTKLGWSIKYRVPIEFVGNRISAEYWTYHTLMLFLKYEKEKEKNKVPSIMQQVNSPSNLVVA